ncbi:acyl-CoA dehydrogenase [Mycolicibacterium madagascariense]|uniref:Acyl-CoA dehydrogenase n=1 Tax=Mycolicibacterium madagascariense TaxID=212765 RepID=A0A7I7XCC6_9MYCO|nr:acyl-CoA dehydrogenase family protein [Mycolicibacterium madagascariense]MCV7011655.1 acyl-CoA/acyl-ACP dehydrogenase [Mycolicibacterium madagascariense]BBZ27286.1 acyl-CoA dehydrogenase [Mycolicibacterium madagascariense]
MDFGLTEEQDQLAEAERSWLTRHDPIARVRATLDGAPITVDPDARAHAAESGLLSLLTPEMGGTHVDLAVVAEAHGHAASSLPIADVALATWLLNESGLPRGEFVGLARCADATADGGSLRLTGASSPVPMAADLDAVAIVGLVGDEEFAAVSTAPTTTPMATLDLTRSWARLTSDGVIDEWHTVPTGTVGFVRDALAVHRAFDALGAAERLLQMTVEYAGQREQFGVPIGSFQAVKHHCADMLLAVEAARAALWAGALALDTATGAARTRAASAAAAYAKSAAARVAGTALQVHGGIGFTWEHDLHLLLRRIKVDEAFDGTVTEHRAALVTA